MNLVDSSGWLEYFADSKNAGFFAPAILDSKNLIVPSICIFEVFKRILHQKDENYALEAVTAMQQAAVIELNLPLAIHAAKISRDLKLPMADSIILATARAYEAIIWTQDADFKDLNGVKFIKEERQHERK